MGAGRALLVEDPHADQIGDYPGYLVYRAVDLLSGGVAAYRERIVPMAYSMGTSMACKTGDTSILSL